MIEEDEGEGTRAAVYCAISYYCCCFRLSGKCKELCPTTQTFLLAVRALLLSSILSPPSAAPLLSSFLSPFFRFCAFVFSACCLSSLFSCILTPDLFSRKIHSVWQRDSKQPSACQHAGLVCSRVCWKFFSFLCFFAFLPFYVALLYSSLHRASFPFLPPLQHAKNSHSFFLSFLFNLPSFRPLLPFSFLPVVVHSFSSVCGGTSGEVTWVTVDREYIYVCGTFQTVTNCDGHVIPVDNIARFSVVKNHWESMGDKGKRDLRNEKRRRVRGGRRGRKERDSGSISRIDVN